MSSILDINPNKEKAISLAKRQLPEFVYDAVNLEGIKYTLPEVQNLLEGITVGGYKLEDEHVTLHQAEAWKLLFHLLETDRFFVKKPIACQLHAVAAKGESLEWGCFRSGGATIAGTDYQPPEASELDASWEQMLFDADDIENIFDKAIFIFLQMARNQFYYDVNKRLGRFMMNGLLLSKGMPAINLPAKKQAEFNRLMLAFYSSGDVKPMTEFMKSCLDSKIIKIMNEK